eukprot:5954396-Pleurochrysis_carterae.AAC.1
MVADRRAMRVGRAGMSPMKAADLRQNRDCLDRAWEMAIDAVDSQRVRTRTPLSRGCAHGRRPARAEALRSVCVRAPRRGPAKA